MKHIFTILFVLFLFNGQSQISKSYFHNSISSGTTGNFIVAHPTEWAVFTAATKNLNGTGEIILSKLDLNGNTLWHQTNPISGTPSLSGATDIAVNATNIFVATFQFNGGTNSQAVIYKYDFNGILVDSASVTHANGLSLEKSEIAFNDIGMLGFSYLTNSSNEVRFTLIDPSNMSTIYDYQIGQDASGGSSEYQNMFVDQSGNELVVAYGTPDSIHVVRLDYSALVIDQFAYSLNNGEMVDFKVNNGNYFALVNTTTAPTVPSDNPVRIIEFTPSGALVGDNSHIPQGLHRYTCITFHNSEIFVGGRNPQASSSLDGSIIKITSGITMEAYLEESAISDLLVITDLIIGAGISNDGITSCLDNHLGLVFMQFQKDEIPMSAVVSPNMSLISNNISASINYQTANFQKHFAGSAGFEVDGSGSTIYSTQMLIAGEDLSAQVHKAGSFYYAVYAAGPITNEADYIQTEKDKYERVWIISKQEIDEHINAFVIGDPTYKTPEAILNWPAHGDPLKGQDANLARFKDINNNGTYEPLEGEYPLILGDYCALSIYNDHNIDTSQSCVMSTQKLDIQVLEYVYGFECNTDSSQQNTLFVHYEITNKSNDPYYNTYVGNFLDFDINLANDDYVGTDANRGMCYGMNGNGIGPQQGYIVLGSTTDDDGLDNPSGISSGQSINGFGFGDGTTDNERLGLTNSIAGTSGGGSQGDPNSALDFYYYLQSMWLNGSHQTYGGSGFVTSSIDANLAFTDSDDPLFYGTEGIDPGGPWSEALEGHPVGDRRMVGSSGPFTFSAGDTLNFDVAFVTGMENTGAGYTSHEAMDFYADSVRSYYAANQIACGQDFDFYEPFDGPYTTIGMTEQNWKEIKLYPNPAHSGITLTNIPEGAQIQIINLSGSIISNTQATSELAYFDIQNLPSGTYIIRISDMTITENLKFVKL